MATKKNYKQHFDETWEDSFFAYIANRTVCLLCGFELEPACVKKYVFHRHYDCKHSKEYSVYEGQEKSTLIAALKLVSVSNVSVKFRIMKIFKTKRFMHCMPFHISLQNTQDCLLMGFT